MQPAPDAGVDDLAHELVDAVPAPHRRPWRSGCSVESSGIGALPTSAFSTAPTAAARMAWPLGYSGCIGVSISGVQPGSATVASLPSMSPLRIAVTGRQNW